MSSIVNNNAAGVVGTTDHLAKTAGKVMVTADNLFTAVGDLRASIGPPIMIIEAGVASPAEAIREIAPKVGTVG